MFEKKEEKKGVVMIESLPDPMIRINYLQKLEATEKRKESAENRKKIAEQKQEAAQQNADIALNWVINFKKIRKFLACEVNWNIHTKKRKKQSGC